MMASIVAQHQSSPEPEPTTAESKIQPGRSINWGGELWTVIARRGEIVWLSEGGHQTTRKMLEDYSRACVAGPN